MSRFKIVRLLRSAFAAPAVFILAFTGLGAAGASAGLRAAPKTASGVTSAGRRLAPIRSRSNVSGPTVTITPRTQTYTGGRFIDVTVSICSAYPNPSIASETFTLNSTDVSSSFSDVTAQHSAPAGCTGANDDWQWWTASLALNVGDNVLSVTANDQGSFVGSDEVTYTRPTAERSVIIMADEQNIDHTAGQSGTARFTVLNTGAASTTFTISSTCSGMTCGSPSPASVTIGAGQSAATAVTYTAPGSGSTGTINITASNSTPTVVSDKTWTDVTGVSAPSAGAELSALYTGGSDAMEKSLCLTVSAGSGLAVQCGELRAVHPLPMVKTLNTTRVPTLIYSSEEAHPMPIVHADVTITGTLPTTVQAILTVNGTQVTNNWNGTDWVSGETRRIAVQVDASTWATGLYPYTLVVNEVTGGTPTLLTSLSGNLPVVNRSASPFGAGWWLAGLEQLINPGDGTRFWIGGDGSTRRYSSAGTNIWTATAIDRADTLTFDGTYYYRHLANNVLVKFDGSGRHVATINRLGYSTVFNYTTAGGRDVLSTMDVPVLSGTAPRYTFNYNSAGQLTTVDAPHPSGSGSRTVTLTPQSTTGRIDVIKDATGDSVRFGYDATITTRMTARSDRRGFQTGLSYDGGRVSSSTLVIPGQTIAESYLPMETAGLPGATRGAAQPPDSTFTQIDGPRTDASDVTRAWFTRYGVVSRVRNPVGRETSATYGNGSFPALPTSVKDPNHFVTNAYYNSRGLVDSAVAVDPLGGQGNAKTTYTWHGSLDLPTRIISPLGTSSGSDTQFSYDSNNGNRLWQQTGADSTRVSFGYYTNGLLASIVAPSTTADSLHYDTTLGNLLNEIGPNTAVTSYSTDAIGRDTLTTIPIDATHAGHVHTQFDIADRPIKTITMGPALSGGGDTFPADSIIVDQTYDAEGNVTSVARSRGVYWAGYASLSSTMEYDGANRKTSETNPGRTDSYAYDPAGNVTTHTTPLGSVTSTYDPAGRLLRRVVPEKTYASTSCSAFLTQATCTYSFPTTGASSVCVPADTAYFGYDAAGRIIRADNGRARVRRSYKPNGLLAEDTLRIRTYYSAGSSTCEVEPTGNGPFPSTEWTTHVYRLANSYDLDGRRTQLVNPLSTITYSYDGAGRGLMTGVAESGFTSTTIANDAVGRIRSVTSPGNVVDTRYYGSDGLQSGRFVEINGSTTLANDGTWYDLRGLVDSAYTGYRRGVYSGLTAHMAYNGLGALAVASNDVLSDGQAEHFKVDAIGNRLRIARPGFKPTTSSDFLGVRFQSYDQYARMTQVDDSATGSGDDYVLQEIYQYDAAGTQNLDYTYEWTSSGGGTYDAVKSYPSIDDRISVVDRHIGVGSVSSEASGHHAVYQENWYDALGRRVLVRARKASNCSSTFGDLACKSYVERTIWDGDQVLVENRADGASGLTSGQLDTESSTSSGAFGQVISLHANGIDAPVAVRKAGNTTIAPYANWKGDYEVGTTADGTPTSSCTGTTSCPALDWPGGNENADGQKVLPAALDTWWGSLIAGKTDASGMKYMRNRYYNPSNGQFTQQDPIGLAGGINLYGFASGDPVNFRDPFGLCVPWCTALAGAAIGGTAAALGTMWYNHANGQPLTTNLGRNALVGAGAGAVAGATLGLGAQAFAALSTATGAAAANIDKIAAEAQAMGPRLGQQISAAGQLVGKLKLGQQGAADALGKTLGKLGAEYGQATIGGVHYFTAAMAKNGVVNAIGINGDGSTFNAMLKLGQKGLEVMK